MTHFRVAGVALADAGTVRTVLIVRADALPTVGPRPPIRTRAASVGRIARCPILAAARFRAVDTEQVAGTGIQTLGAHKPGRTDTLARHPVAIGPVEAFTPIRTLEPVQTRLATVGTNQSRIPGRTNTLTRDRIARPTVLAAALRLALPTVRSCWAAFRAEWTGESWRTETLARHVIARAAIFAPAHLGTVLPKPMAGAFLLTVPALVPTLTATATVGRIANRIVHALALLRTVRTPQIRWTLNVAGLAGVTLIAAAHVRLNALAVPASGLTFRHAVLLPLVQFVPDAALLHDALLDDRARLVHRPDLDPVRRTAGWYAQAPLLVPLLVCFLARCRYRDGDVFHFLAHVRALQVVILDEFGKRRHDTGEAGRGQDQQYHT